MSKSLKMMGVRLSVRHFTNRNIMALKKRELINDVFPAGSEKAIADLVNGSCQCVYAGFDPTADSLHVGNLLVLMKLLHWQRGGHDVIALVGGATGAVGDPSGRTQERRPLSQETIDRNVQSISDNIRTVFSNHERLFWRKDSAPLKPLTLLDNRDWYRRMTAVDFVADLGRNFRMGTMLLKQSVRTRIDSDAGMSFSEFAYQIFQAYDWLHLHRERGCRFQVGGSDQMGNMLAGHDLIHRFSPRQVYGITLPIIATEEGDKFGKSAGNAVWLDPEKTSPYSFYQFFVRTKDSQVEKFLKYFTFLNEGEINQVMHRHNLVRENFEAQKVLAESLTKLVHGEEGLQKALKTTRILFSRRIEDLLDLTVDEIHQAFEGATTVPLLLEPGMSVLELAMKAKCFPTTNDAARIIKAGGFHVNHQKCSNCEEILTQAVHIMPNNISLLRVGKKHHYIVKWFH